MCVPAGARGVVHLAQGPGLTMATYQTIVLLNLSVWENPNKPGTGYSLDVVQSVVDGQSKGVGVEKVYFKDDGAKRIGKPLQRNDFRALKQRWSEVLGLMENPPPVPPPPAVEPLAAGGIEASPMDSAPLECDDPISHPESTL